MIELFRTKRIHELPYNQGTVNAWECSDENSLLPAPLVSVLMLTYNHQKFIANAIESILAQKTSFPIELIIGEDCSLDDTLGMVMSYQKKTQHK